MERKQASEYPQELLDLFHEYQHGEITRRDFLDRAAKFAVGGLTVTGDLGEPQAQLRVGPAGAQGRHADHGLATRPSRRRRATARIKGYLVTPGQRDRQAADRARDPREPRAQPVHRGRRAPPRGPRTSSPSRPTASRRSAGTRATTRRARRRSATVDGPKMAEDFVASARWLKARPESSGKIGAVGFCFGGGIVNQLAVRMPDLGAGVPFYGRQAGRRRRAEDQGAAPAALRRRTIRASTPGSRPTKRRSRPTTRPTTLYIYEAPSTGSTTTRPRATTSRPPSSPGSARSTSSTRPFASAASGERVGPRSSPRLTPPHEALGSHRAGRAPPRPQRAHRRARADTPLPERLAPRRTASGRGTRPPLRFRFAPVT